MSNPYSLQGLQSLTATNWSIKSKVRWDFFSIWRIYYLRTLNWTRFYLLQIATGLDAWFRGKYSCTGILVFPGWEWKIYYSSQITFHERHVWISLMFLNFVKNFPVRIFWEELLSAQEHIFLVSYEKIPEWISFDAGSIFPFRNAWIKVT